MNNSFEQFNRIQSPVEKPGSEPERAPKELAEITFSGTEQAEKDPKDPTKSRKSGILRVVGAPNAQAEESLTNRFQQIFEAQPIQEIGIQKNFFKEVKFKELERPKTPEEQEMIELINKNMAEFVTQYGGSPLDITSDKVYFIDKKNLNEKIMTELGFNNGSSYYSNYYEAIVMDPKEGGALKNTTPLISKADTLAHEFIHFNSFQSVTHEKRINGPDNFSWRRCGIEIKDSKNKQANYLGDLNEALTEELAMRFGRKYFGQIPSLAQEWSFMQEVEETFKDEFVKEAPNLPYYQSGVDVGWVDREDYVHRHSYSRERKDLGRIIRIIFQRNPGEFQSEEEVFEKFARAYFSGKILEVARLIEKSFPIKGAFRRIAEDRSYKKIKI